MTQEDKEAARLGCMKSVEGFVVCVTGLHEETLEEDLLDQFHEFGRVRNIHLNTDR